MNKFFYGLLAILFLASCSKKTSEMVEAPSMPEKADQSWRSAMPTAAPARPIKIADYQSFDLDNGLKVIVVENHKLPRVSYQVSLLNEPIVEGDKAGYVSMAGQLISTGTTERSKAELDAATDFIGANINSNSGGIFGSSLVKHQNSLLDIMTEMLYKASFPEAEFDKLKKQTLSNITSSKDDPNAIAGNVASVVNYGKDHPYGEVETEKTIENINLEDCKSYYNEYFRPNNAYLIIVGDIDLATARQNAEKYFGTWLSGDIPAEDYVTPNPPQATNVHFADKAGAVQSVIRVTYPITLKPGQPDVLKARVLNNILGGGVFAGRLMQNLREDKGYTYGARSSISADRLVGTFNASASVRNEVTDSSVVQFLYEMEKIAKEPVSSDDLQLAKNSISGSFARSLESPQTIAGFARNTFRYNLPKDYYSNYLQRLDGINESDVLATAQSLIKSEKANIIVVGNKDEVAESLLPFDSDGKIDYYGPFGQPRKYDQMEVPSDISASTIISDYIEAIGGKEALMATSSLKTEMEGTIMGQTANMETNQKKPGYYNMSIQMQGMVLQEQKYNGEQAVTSQMGQKQTFTEGREFDAMKKGAIMFPQLDYAESNVELSGIEDVDGAKAYKLIVTHTDGSKTTEYYDVNTSYLIRTVENEEGPGGQKITVTTDIADYKEVGGIMLPHTMTVSGALPQPLTMNVKQYTLNGAMDDTLFNE